MGSLSGCVRADRELRDDLCGHVGAVRVQRWWSRQREQRVQNLPPLPLHDRQEGRYAAASGGAVEGTGEVCAAHTHKMVVAITESIANRGKMSETNYTETTGLGTTGL